MIIETIIATLALMFMLMGAHGAMNSRGNVIDFFIGLYVTFAMAVEVLTSVINASTNVSHIGSVREVSFFVIAAGILTLWRFPAWFLRAEEHRA